MAVHERKEWERFDKWLFAELFLAYEQARKGKRKKYDEHIFEMNVFENLARLRDAILNRDYKPDRGIAFVTKTPVYREIFAATFRDRVVHQFLYNVSADWWDKRLSYDVYSGRKGKGTWFGIERAAKHIRQVSQNYKYDTYVIKLDIMGYFVSIKREVLLDNVLFYLKKQFPERGELYRTVRFLWERTLLDDPCKGVKKIGNLKDFNLIPRSKSLFFQEEGRGIVAGNLTSQLASNVFLNKLDRYVRFGLGYKHYGRYADDFYLIVRAEDKEKALEDVRRIQRFLREEMGLTLHPHKRYVQNVKRGMPFLGAVIYPGRVVPGRRVVREFRKRIREVKAGERDIDSVVSYVGFMKNLNGYNLTKRIFEEVGMEFEGF